MDNDDEELETTDELIPQEGPDYRTPESTMSDDEVEGTAWSYSDRAVDDWVISGPLGDQPVGKGRWFRNWTIAEFWARTFYGDRVRGPVAELHSTPSLGRWGFVIRGPRGVDVRSNKAKRAVSRVADEG